MAVIFLLVTVTLAYTVQTAVTDPGEGFEISSCQEKLPRSTEASKLPSFMDSRAVACIIPSWEEPARAQLLKSDPSQLQHGVSLR